jgi:hypothetical protein
MKHLAVYPTVCIRLQPAEKLLYLFENISGKKAGILGLYICVRLRKYHEFLDIVLLELYAWKR